MPIHDIASVSHDASRATAVFAPAEALAETSGGNRDYILQYRLQGEAVELYEDGPENSFLLMVQPPKRVMPEQIPPREYVFIVDISGSMSGFPLQTAKALLRDLVSHLRPIDTLLASSDYCCCLCR